MNLPYFIARKIHFNAEGGKKATPPAVRIAMAGIALGLAVMLVSVSIIVGFKKEVREKVIGFGSHIQITNFDSNASFEYEPIAVSDSLLNRLRLFPEIRHVETFATKPGLIKTDADYQGVVLKGVGDDYDWSFFKKHLKEGEIPVVDREQRSTDVIISYYIANRLGVQLGDDILTYFVQDEVRARRFHVVGIYDSGYLEYDKLFIVGDIKQIRRLNAWDADLVSGIELLVKDYNRVDEVAEQLFYDLSASAPKDRLGNTYFIRSVKDLNPMIFNWLEALDINVVLILVLMMAVSGFTMISGLLIIILERINMIGILKALGQNNMEIRKVFLYVSFFLIGKGMIWGNVIGIGICLIQSYFKVFTLDPATYYLDAVPIDLSLLNVILVNLGALAVSMLMMLGPTWMISKVEPARSIRFD